MADAAVTAPDAAPGHSDPARSLWLFSAPVDLAAFVGSAVVGLGAAWFAERATAGDAMPEAAWIGLVLLVDVAHVYGTLFRVYLDPPAFRRRPALYLGLPVAAWLAGVVLYSESAALFWRVLAYLAVFHFVRQQVGWTALYRARCGDRDPLGNWLVPAATYAATIYPLLDWHARLPRPFEWFVAGDFVPLARIWATAGFWCWAGLLGAYALYVLARGWRGVWNPGETIVVATTAVCWYVGIVLCNSDLAFTATNVLIHGVPYLVLTYWFARRGGTAAPSPGMLLVRILATVWLLAIVEELVWDRGVWHERSWLFGPGWDLDSARVWLVPLLAVPQATHYLLDGLVWRHRDNPELAGLFATSSAHAPPA